MKKPALYLVICFAWLYLFLLVDLVSVRQVLEREPRAFLADALALFPVAVGVICLHVIESKWAFWRKSSLTKKAVIMAVSYTAVTALSLGAVSWAFSNRLIAFTSCPAGSFGMLYIPSVGLAWIVLLVIGTLDFALRKTGFH